MKSITAGGRKYKLYNLTGKVIKCEKRIVSHTTGSGGGGYSYNGNGHTAPVHITTTHITKDQLFLIDEEGKEHAINLTDFNLDCREGHQLELVWAIAENKDKGSYIAVKNFDTHCLYFDDEVLTKMHVPSLVKFWGGISAIICIGFITGNLLLAIPIALLSIIFGNKIIQANAGSAAKNFKAAFSFGDND